MTLQENQTHEEAVEAVAQRLLDMALGTADLLAVYLGDRLGWYRSLSVDGPATAEELAARTRTDTRYAREWLEQQAVSGLLTVDVVAEQRDAPGDAGPARRFRVPAAAAEVLTDSASLSYLAPLARMFVASAVHMPALLDAYGAGGGVSWAQLGADARESQADMNRPWFETALAPALTCVPALHDRLARAGARIADVGCGAGWSTIALARAYPAATVIGVDVDEPSLALARGAADDADLGARVQFRLADGADLPAAGFDAVFAFECLHDMPDPVAVLTAARRALAPDGTVVVMDEAVAESFTAPGDELERLMYGFSLLVCLPDGMSHDRSVGTGTVMRPSTLRGYAHDAGFSRVDVLPIEGFGFWRFYELYP
jgi:SAM-dependent methyltransferase